MTDVGSTMARQGHGHGVDPVWARVRPLVFRTIIGAVIAAGLVGIVAVLLGDFGLVAVQLLLTIVVVVVFALLSWYDADVSSRRSGVFAFASVLTSLYLLVVGLLKTWVLRDDRYGDGAALTQQSWEWFGLVFVARVALLHVHLLLVIHRRFPTPLLRVVAKSTVVVIAVLALLLSLPLLAPTADFAPAFWRTVWVVVILDLLGTVVVPLSNALFRPRQTSPTGPAPDRVVPSSPAPTGVWGGPTAAPVGAPGRSVWDEPDAAEAIRASWTATPAPTDASPTDTSPRDASPTDTPATASAATATATVMGADGLRYERRPDAARALAWPRYVDGTPVPARADGSPDFDGVDRS